MNLPVPSHCPSIQLHVAAMAVGAAHDEWKEYLVEDYSGFNVGPLGIALQCNLAPLVVGEHVSRELGAVEGPIR